MSRPRPSQNRSSFRLNPDYEERRIPTSLEDMLGIRTDPEVERIRSLDTSALEARLPRQQQRRHVQQCRTARTATRPSNLIGSLPPRTPRRVNSPSDDSDSGHENDITTRSTDADGWEIIPPELLLPAELRSSDTLTQQAGGNRRAYRSLIDVSSPRDNSAGQPLAISGTLTVPVAQAPSTGSNRGRSFSTGSLNPQPNERAPRYSTVYETGSNNEGPPSYEEALLSPKPSSGAIQSYEDSIRPVYTHETSPPAGSRVVRSLVAEAECYAHPNRPNNSTMTGAGRIRARSNVRSPPPLDDNHVSKLKKKRREQQPSHRSPSSSEMLSDSSSQSSGFLGSIFRRRSNSAADDYAAPPPPPEGIPLELVVDRFGNRTRDIVWRGTPRNAHVPPLPHLGEASAPSRPAVLDFTRRSSRFEQQHFGHNRL